MNTHWLTRMMDLALLVGSWSKDPSTRVGAVIVDSQRRIVGTGYNGFPRGVVDQEERYQNRELKLAMVVHAEVNAVLNAVDDVRSCTLVSTRAPCSGCSGVIIQSGVDVVVCPNQPANSRWAADWLISRHMLEEAGVCVTLVEMQRDGVTAEEYYQRQLQSIAQDLGWHECSPTCHCPVPNEAAAKKTMGELLRKRLV